MITRPIEIAMVRCTSLTEARMVVVRSLSTVMSIDAGMDACNCGSTSRTRSTVSTMFAPGWRKMYTITAGLPFDEADVAHVLHRILHAWRRRKA